MGDPRRQRAKYEKPSHPWQGKRILDEAKLTKEYGLSNKKEIWKMASMLRKWQLQARELVGMLGDQRESSAKILVDSLKKKGVLKEKATYEDILSLAVRDVMDRRLQSIVYKKGMANTPKQARQFILHGKVLVNNRVVNSPAHMVLVKDEVSLIPGFTPAVVKKAQEELAKSEIIKEKRAEEKKVVEKVLKEEPKEKVSKK